MTAPRTALITGASSGFGLLTTLELARRGWHVLATMRDLERRKRLQDAAQDEDLLSRIEFCALDVTRPEQIAALADQFTRQGTLLHAVVNNAGFAMAGFADDVSDEELRQQLDTNFFAAAAVTRAFLPHFRRQGHGRIVMLSSISGRLGFPGISSYAASKFALEGWSESLRHELRPLGIHVSLVEPGSFETDIWSRNAVISNGSQDAQSPNAARLDRWRARHNTGKPKGDPQIVARTIANVLEARNPRLRYLAGADARLALALRTLLPGPLWETIVRKAAGTEQ